MAGTAVGEYLDSVRVTLLNSTAARREQEERCAPDFAVLPYISPDENRLSEILSDLLNPEGNHGQGAAFLQCFLKRIGVSRRLPPHVIVTCEDRAAYCQDFRSRIDITIDIGGFEIGIENKPWAQEGERQLERYAEHLEEKYHGKYVLVFISPHGRPPRSFKSAKLKTLSYSRDLPQWLEQCRSCCKARHVGWFLSDLQRYLQQEFGTGATAEEEVWLEPSTVRR